MPYTLPPVGGHPMSHRIAARILSALKDGEYAKAELLPSENELAARYGVSRSVIRDALGDLESEGYLQRMRGIGTIIHRDVVALKTRLDLKFEYNELIRGMGYTPRADSVAVRLERADETLAAQLHIDVGEDIIVCEKRMLAGDRPVIYSIDRLPRRLFDGIAYAALDWSQPVFDLLESALGFAVDTDIANLSAVVGPPDIRRRLEVAEGDALLFIDEVGYYRLAHPILQTYGYYTNFFEFVVLRKRF